MPAKAGRWATALARLRGALWGPSPLPPRESDALREQFDRDYDELLGKMVVSSADPTPAPVTPKRGA